MSRPAAGERELRRALWRWDYGLLSPTRLRRLLRAEHLRAGREYAALAPGLAAVRRHDPALLDAADAARARAEAALRGERHRAALDAVLATRRALAAMADLAAADARVREAERAVNGLHARAGAPGLRALPCLSTPRELARKARLCMGDRRYHEAGHLAAAALAELRAVDAREPMDRDRLAGLEARLEEVREVYAATRTAAETPERLRRMGDTVDAALALARQGYLALATRAADEMRFALADRFRFRDEMRRAGGDAAADAEILRGVLAGRGDGEAFSTATATLWRSRVEAGLRRTGDLHRRMDASRERLGLAAAPAPNAGGEAAASLEPVAEPVGAVLEPPIALPIDASIGRRADVSVERPGAGSIYGPDDDPITGGIGRPDDGSVTGRIGRPDDDPITGRIGRSEDDPVTGPIIGRPVDAPRDGPAAGPGDGTAFETHPHPDDTDGQPDL